MKVWRIFQSVKIITLIMILFLGMQSAYAPILKPWRGEYTVNKAHQLGDFIAGWLFNEGSGRQVFDSSGNGKTGTRYGTGAIWTPGIFGSAQQFNQTDDYIDFANITSIPGPITFISWVNVPSDNWQSQFQWSFSKDDSADTYLTKEYEQSGGGPLRHKLTVRIGWGDIITIYSDGNCTPNVWEHVAIIRDNSNVWKMVINGIEQADTGVAAGVMDVSGYHQFGKYAENTTHWYGGKAEVLSIYNRELSVSSEIALLYREPFCMFERRVGYLDGIAAALYRRRIIIANLQDYSLCSMILISIFIFVNQMVSRRPLLTKGKK